MSQLIEQETTATAGRADDVTYVYSNVPKHVRRLRSDKRATQIEGDDTWGRWTIPSDAFDPLRGFKRASRPMSPEQREAASLRLAAARAGTTSQGSDTEDANA